MMSVYPNYTTIDIPFFSPKIAIHQKSKEGTVHSLISISNDPQTIDTYRGL
jgi:hypothetical protein